MRAHVPQEGRLVNPTPQQHAWIPSGELRRIMFTSAHEAVNRHPCSQPRTSNHLIKGTKPWMFTMHGLPQDLAPLSLFGEAENTCSARMGRAQGVGFRYIQRPPHLQRLHGGGVCGGAGRAWDERLHGGFQGGQQAQVLRLLAVVGVHQVRAGHIGAVQAVLGACAGLPDTSRMVLLQGFKSCAGRALPRAQSTVGEVARALSVCSPVWKKPRSRPIESLSDSPCMPSRQSCRTTAASHPGMPRSSCPVLIQAVREDGEVQRKGNHCLYRHPAHARTDGQQHDVVLQRLLVVDRAGAQVVGPPALHDGRVADVHVVAVQLHVELRAACTPEQGSGSGVTGGLALHTGPAGARRRHAVGTRLYDGEPGHISSRCPRVWSRLGSCRPSSSCPATPMHQRRSLRRQGCLPVPL